MMHPSSPVSRRTLLTAALATPLAVPLAGALSGCGVEDSDDSGGGPAADVTYLTNFGTLGRDSYAWLAADRGLFDQAGLSVSIEPGSGTTPNLQALLAGQAQFAAVDLAGAAMAATEQDGFVAIAAIQQRPLAAVMAYADSGISVPGDLAGKRVGLPTGAITELLFPAYLDAVVPAIDPNEVERVALEPSGLVPALASGRVDAIGQFVVGEPLIAAAGGGRQVVVLPYDEYLGDLYGVGLLTTTELAANGPQLCVRFRDALLGGLELAMAEPEAAGQVLAERFEETDPEVAAAEMEAMVPYSQGGPGVPLGHIDDARMARHIALLSSVGLLGRNPVLEPEDLTDFALVPGAEH